MTTSGVTAWSLTAGDLITTAFQEAKIYGGGEVPSDEDMTAGILRLNGMLKSFETKGYTLWRQSTAAATVSGSPATTLADDVYDVEAVRFVTSATNERPLTAFERDDYKLMPNKALVGNPSVYYVDRQRDIVDLYLWPVPASGTVNIDYLRKIETVTLATQTVDIPEDWQEPIYTLLAIRLCSAWGVEPTQELALRAQRLEREMDDQDRPSSYFMGSFQ